jgi:hypothetical protein
LDEKRTSKECTPFGLITVGFVVLSRIIDASCGNSIKSSSLREIVCPCGIQLSFDSYKLSVEKLSPPIKEK